MEEEKRDSSNEESRDGIKRWRKRSGKEERVLIADHVASRGWECSHVLVVDLFGRCGLENLIMRTVGYCAVVKEAPKGPFYDLRYNDDEEELEGDMLSIAIALSLVEQ